MTTPYETQIERPPTERGVDDSPPHKGDQPSGARRRTRLMWITVGAIVVVGAGIAYGLFTQDQGTAANVETGAGPAATVEVVRETIADTRSFAGTLGFGEALTVTTTGQGVVTGLADQGSQLAAGTELFRLDERPVTAMLGEIPMYRDLELGDLGADVAQLIDNLTQLGFADCEAHDEVTGCVQAAIVAWQAELGVDETGRVGLTDVVFVSEAGRVDTIHARVGQAVSPGTPVLDITGSDQVVTLEIEVRDRDLLAAGTDAMVQLPGGDEVAGTVTAANVVHGDAGQGNDSSVDDAIARVEVTLDVPVDASLLGGPADVVVERGEREDVLTVPVNALVAMAEGGHGLEVVADDATTSIVPVETGLFAAGRVEVSGDGIDEGTVVGVAGR